MSQPAAPPPSSGPSVPYGPGPTHPGTDPGLAVKPAVTVNLVGSAVAKWTLRTILFFVLRAVLRALFRR